MLQWQSVICIESLKGPMKREPLHVSQKRDPMEGDAHFQSLTISFGVPSKRALPQGSLQRVPHREMPRS